MSLSSSAPSSLVCDCQELRPPDLGELSGLFVHAASGHLARRLPAVLGAHGVPFEARGRSVLLPREAFAALPAVLAAFSRTERADLRAAPQQPGGGPDPWQTAPFEAWVERLGSPWFAAACEELLFYLQPIVTLATGEVYGQEALVRAHLNGELIGAGALLQAAQVHGQARAFDAQARRVAIRTAYPRLKGKQVLFINFAPGVVYNPDVCLQTTFQACREVNADFSRLLFEVTESEAFPDLRLLGTILERYRAEGAQVALDDLGAGQTSLNYLAALRPDLVKLDRGLIQGLHGSDPRVPLIGALITYAHDLGIRVVAEGIETEAELGMVRELGADYAQGYLLGRPAPAAPL